jgi:hypothetical protein
MALLKRELHRASRGPILTDEDTWQLVFDTDSKRLYVEHRWHTWTCAAPMLLRAAQPNRISPST